MAKARYNTRIGDTFNTTLTIVDQDDAAQDITGATVRMVVTDRNGAELAAISQTTHDTPASGITTLTIPKETTAAWAQGVYAVQIVCELSDASEFEVIRGTIEVRYDHD